MRDALPNTTYVTERQKAKAKWTTLESIVGNLNRIQNLAKDIVNHFEQRQKVFEGKVMIVAMSRRIAADLYKQITALRPEWHDDDFNKGVIKVVMTSSSADKIAFDAEHPTANAPNQGTFARPTKPTPPLPQVLPSTGTCFHDWCVKKTKPLQGRCPHRPVAKWVSQLTNKSTSKRNIIFT